MKKIMLITQGSQAIQLIRELFSLGYSPSDLLVLTIKEDKNNSFIEFLTYYNVIKVYVNKENVNDYISYKNNLDLIISFSNPFILNSRNVNKNLIINFHPGIIPEYRGSLSTVYSMINGEKYVGGTWHYVNEDVDMGNILKINKVKIKPKDTAFSLNHKIFSKSISELDEVLSLVKSGHKGEPVVSKGRFYYNKFPDLSGLDLDLKKRIEYFPPNNI